VALATGNGASTARLVVPDISVNAGTFDADRLPRRGHQRGLRPDGRERGNDLLTALGEDPPPLRATRGYDDETGHGTPGLSLVTAFGQFRR
jgi:hypothetical protein